MLRWLRTRQDEIAGITLMALVSVATVLSVHGVPARTATAVAMTLAEIGLLAGRHAPPRLQSAAIALAVLAGFTALAVAPGGIAEVPILAAAVRLPRTLSARRRDPVTIGLGVALRGGGRLHLR